MDSATDLHRLLSAGIFMLGNKCVGGKPLCVQQWELCACVAQGAWDGAGGVSWGFGCCAGERTSVKVQLNRGIMK